VQHFGVERQIRDVDASGRADVTSGALRLDLKTMREWTDSKCAQVRCFVKMDAKEGTISRLAGGSLKDEIRNFLGFCQHQNVAGRYR
jgi:hypothetical protein